MIKLVQILIKITYIVLSLLILIRTFLKANGVSTINFQHRGLLKMLYEFTDQLIAPVNFILQQIALVLPSSTHKFFPALTVDITHGQLEWACLITLGLCLIVGISIERYLANLSEHIQAIFSADTRPQSSYSYNNETDKLPQQDNNSKVHKLSDNSSQKIKPDKDKKSLRRLKEEKEQSQKESHKNQALKSAYNLIIKRLDREKTELLNKNISLEKEIITDPLTGLKSRKYMQEKLKYEYNNCKVKKQDLSIIMMDIDHFKRINDTHGHQKGDQVLKDVSRIIINSCKGNIVASRYGGEEILIIGPKVGSTEARVLAESIRQTIEASVKCGDSNDRVTISAGVATYNGNTTLSSVNILIEEADNALYQAKDAGRNRVKTYIV